jgi:hypothetical protein
MEKFAKSWEGNLDTPADYEAIEKVFDVTET